MNVNFNEGQLKAITSEAKRIMCLAGAGAGKTRTLIERIYSLHVEEKVPYDKILCVTFTRAAGLEMKQRIMVKDKDASKMFASTIHSFGCEVIETFGERLGYDQDFTIYDSQDEKDIIQATIAKLAFKLTYDNYMNFLKGDLDENLEPEKYSFCEKLQPELAEIYFRHNAVTFSGILEVTKRLLSDEMVQQYYHNKYKYIFVDEYQDCNQIHTDIIEMINPDNLFVVGDIKQSIYGWNGAVPENFEQFPERHEDVEVIIMNDNYRSTSQIIQAANNLFKGDTKGYDLNMIPHKEGPGLDFTPYNTDSDEVYYTIMDILDKHANIGDAAVLTRTNRTAQKFADKCEELDIKYNLYGGQNDPLKDDEFKDLMTILKAAYNPKDNFTVERLFKVLRVTKSMHDMSLYYLKAFETGMSLYEVIKEDAGPEIYGPLSIIESLDVGPISDITHTLQDIIDKMYIVEENLEKDLTNRNYTIKKAQDIVFSWKMRMRKRNKPVTVGSFLRWLMLRDVREKMDEVKDGINIMTIHVSKGLEFKHVYIINCNDGVLPSKKGDAAEERNIMYVATTRAEDQLTISHCIEQKIQYHKNSYPVTKKYKPSPYIREIQRSSLV